MPPTRLLIVRPRLVFRTAGRQRGLDAFGDAHLGRLLVKPDSRTADRFDRRHGLLPWIDIADEDPLCRLQAPIRPDDRCDDCGQTAMQFGVE